MKTRRVIEYLDGTVRGVVIAAGDEERARRNGLKPTDGQTYHLTVLWYAAKRNGLPFTDGTSEDPMLEWAEQISSYDMYLTQTEADAQIAALPPAPAPWKADLDTLMDKSLAMSDERRTQAYVSLRRTLEACTTRSGQAEAIQALVRDDLGEA